MVELLNQIPEVSPDNLITILIILVVLFILYWVKGIFKTYNG